MAGSRVGTPPSCPVAGSHNSRVPAALACKRREGTGLPTLSLRFAYWHMRGASLVDPVVSENSIALQCGHLPFPTKKPPAL
jgi:hypothetical protein